MIFYGAEGKGKWQDAGGASLETFEESLQALSIAKKKHCIGLVFNIKVTSIRGLNIMDDQR